MGRASTPQNRKVAVTKSSLKGLLNFGADNLFPQLLFEIVNTSVTASRCHALRAKFIEGNGFTDPTLSKRVMHRSGLTMDRILSATAENVSMSNVECYHVSFNGLGQIVGLKPVNVELVRLGEPDADGVIRHAGICLYLGSTINKNKAREFTPINLFNPDRAVVLEQIKAAGGINGYNGQLIYNFVAKPGDEYYHAPDYFPCVKDMETEAGLSLFDFATVQNGFNISCVLGFLGNGSRKAEDDPMNNPDSLPYQVSQLQGPTKAGVPLLYEASTLEELKAMTVLPLTGADLKDRYNSTNERVEQRITRAWGVPPPLVGIQRNGVLPTPDELKVASQFMQFTVNPYQRQIQETMQTVLAHWAGATGTPDCSIENLNYFTGGVANTAPAATQAG